jgi:hypothetical protein
MDVNRRIRRSYLIAFLVLIAAVLIPIVVRWAVEPVGPTVELVDLSGRTWTLRLREIEDLPRLCRRGSYENQFGNWRDEGEYCGVLLTELLDAEGDYVSLLVVAEDGYRVEIERERLEDPDYPVVLAFSFDGRTVPDWADGYRIAVLPVDGAVSNADYGVESAGSYWVKNVVRLTLQSQ